MAHVRNCTITLGDDRITKIFFLILQAHDALFNRILGNEFKNLYIAVLTDSISTIRCLILSRNIPPGIKVNPALVKFKPVPPAYKEIKKIGISLVLKALTKC